MADPIQHKGAAKTRASRSRSCAGTHAVAAWIRAKAPSLPNVARLKGILREASCTRCAKRPRAQPRRMLWSRHRDFHDPGRPVYAALPVLRCRPRHAAAARRRRAAHLGETIAMMALKYVVITSVDRDDLRDGGAQHFIDCIRACVSCRPRPGSKS